MPSTLIPCLRKARPLWLIPCTLPLLAQAELRHNLSLDYLRSEHRLLVGQSAITLDPAGWQLGYGLGLDKLSLSGSASQQEDQQSGPQGSQLDYQSRGLGLGFSYRLAHSWLGLDWQHRQDETRAWRTQNATHEQQDSSLDALGLRVGHDVDLDDWQFDMSLGVNYQWSESKTVSRSQIAKALIHRQETSNSEGLLGELSAGLRYLWIVSDSSLLAPGLSLSGSQALSGEARSQLSQGVQGPRNPIRVRNTTQQTAQEGGGDLLLGLSLTWLLNDWSARLGYSTSLTDDLSGDAVQSGISYAW